MELVMTEDQLKKTLNAELADFFGKMTRHLDERLDAHETRIDGRFDQLTNTVDGIAKRLDDDATEQAIINNRHEGWIRQLAENTGTKLVPEQ